MKKKGVQDPESEYLEQLDRFDQFYMQFFSERWPRLKQALIEDKSKVSLCSPRARQNFSDPDFSQILNLNYSQKILEGCYQLDFASLMPALDLEVKPGHKVLDLCAAPGGKSLAMHYSVNGEAKWTFNELSLPRFKRLKSVLRQHLPESEFLRLELTHFDGNRFGRYRSDEFDRVLLDAPCSGERHLLQSRSDFLSWSPKRNKGLAQRQFSLLCSAYDALNEGGILVYSTCSLCPWENEDVAARLLKRNPEAQIVPSQIPLVEYKIESRSLGYCILPDQNNHGPIYWVKIQKTVG